MKKFLAPLIAAAAIVTFGTSVRADPSWTYDWSASTPSVQSDLKNFTMTISPIVNTTSPVTGTSDIIAAQLTYSPVAGLATGTTDHFNNGTFTLAGNIGGQNVSFTVDFSTPSLTKTANGFSSVTTVPFTWSGPVTWGSGSDTWTAEIKSITPPGGDGTTSAVGSILVEVIPPGGAGHQPNPSPEPSTMLLSCVGLAFGGIATWRKRKMAIAA